MDIKELNKKQLVLLTLLITFVVSIATGIVTVSLMQQMPKSVPQTINNVIQRTIEKVTTVQAPTTSTDNTSTTNKDSSLIGDGDVIVSIYPANETANQTPSSTETVPTNNSSTALNLNPSDINANADTTVTSVESKALGQGIIISDVGLILVDSSILNDKDMYKVILNKTDFEATLLKKFTNGFSILKITPQTDTKAPTPSSTGDKPVTIIPSKDLSAQAVVDTTIDKTQ